MGIIISGWLVTGVDTLCGIPRLAGCCEMMIFVGWKSILAGTSKINTLNYKDSGMGFKGYAYCYSSFVVLSKGGWWGNREFSRVAAITASPITTINKNNNNNNNNNH